MRFEKNAFEFRKKSLQGGALNIHKTPSLTTIKNRPQGQKTARENEVAPTMTTSESKSQVRGRSNLATNRFKVQVCMDEHMAGVGWLEAHGVVLIEHDVEDVSAMVEQALFG